MQGQTHFLKFAELWAAGFVVVLVKGNQRPLSLLLIQYLDQRKSEEVGGFFFRA